MPWHVDFLNSWFNFAYCKVIRVDYSEIESFSDQFVLKLKNSLGNLNKDIVKPIKAEVGQFNVGRSGRGIEQLSKSQISRIDDFMKVNLINYV